MVALFEFNVVAGVVVTPDPADNPANHMVPHHEAGAQVWFEVVNVGTADGAAAVGIELDGALLGTATSGLLHPGDGEAGAYSLGRLAAGSHTVVADVSPGSGQNDNASTMFDVA